MRRYSWFSSRKLYGHLSTRLDRNRVVQNLLNVVYAQLVYETHLVCVHKAWITHHVAAVGQIHRQHGATTVLNGTSAVIMQGLIVMSSDVATGEHFFDVRQELRVNSHHILEVSVSQAVLDHPDLAISFEDLRLNLA